MRPLHILLATMGQSAGKFKLLAAPSTVGVAPNFGQRRMLAADGRGNIIVVGPGEDFEHAFSVNNGASLTAVDITGNVRLVKHANGLFHILSYGSSLRYSTVAPGSTAVTFLGSLGSGGFYGGSWDDLVWDGTNYTLFGSNNTGVARLLTLRGPTIGAGMSVVANPTDNTRIAEAIVGPGGGYLVARSGTAIHRIVAGAVTHSYTAFPGAFPGFPNGNILFERGGVIHCMTTTHLLRSTDGIAWTTQPYTVAPAPAGTFLMYQPLGNFDFLQRGQVWYRTGAGGNAFQRVGAQLGPQPAERVLAAHPFIYIIGGGPAVLEALVA